MLIRNFCGGPYCECGGIKMCDFCEQFFLMVRPPEDPWNTHVKPKEWEETVTKLLKKISGVKTGLALLNSIRSGGKRILIEPLNWQACNAHGGAISRVIDKKTFDGIVKFDPDVYLPGSYCAKAKHFDKPGSNRGMQPDEVLFHELIHAHRGALRINDAKPLNGGLYLYTNEEEFLAVVIANVYISDKTNPSSSGLRRNHRGHRPLETNLSSSMTFYKSSPQVLPLIRQFARQEPDFFKALSKINAKFNPFAAFTQCEKALGHLANSKLAHQREVIGTITDIAEGVSWYAKDIMRATGLMPKSAPPVPDLKALLDPLAKEALRVLQR